MNWMPDFCLGRPCVIELTPTFGFSRFLVKCTRHAAIQSTEQITDQGLFDAILQSSRVKEVARYALKVHMGLSKEHPGLSYTVAPDGSMSIQTGLTGQARTAARAAANTAMSTVSKPRGTVTVSVD